MFVVRARSTQLFFALHPEYGIGYVPTIDKARKFSSFADFTNWIMEVDRQETPRRLLFQALEFVPIKRGEWIATDSLEGLGE